MPTAEEVLALLSPPPLVESAKAASPSLRPDELDKVQQIEAHFSKSGFELPVKEGVAGKDGEKRALDEREMMFLSGETFVRYIAATKGDVTAAITRLEETIVWRRSENIEDVEWMAKDCEPESDTGKNILLGFTKQRQPIVYFFPNRNRTPIERRRAVHAVFMLERARDLMTDGVTNVMVIFNFSGKREGPPTSVHVARQTLHILSSHYPETLALNIFQSMPWIVKAFVNLMWPFVDPVTKKKVRFGTAGPNELAAEVDSAQLLSEAGGTLHMAYDHATYWPTMVQTCLRVRQEQLDRFRSLGAPQVGREERLWKILSVEGVGSGGATIPSGNPTVAAEHGVVQGETGSVLQEGVVVA